MPRPTTVRTRQLTIYLIKEALRDHDAIIANRAQHHEHVVTIAPGLDAHLFVKRSRANPPNWVSFFGGHVDLSRLLNSSNAAILLLAVRGRHLAIPFGHAKHMLQPGAYEEGFGLRVALSAIDPRTIKSLDKRTFDAISQHSKHQSDTGASAFEFGIDVEQDMLRAVTGTSTDAMLGHRIVGMDSLVVTVRLELGGLPTLLERILDAHERKAYQQEFPWVDHLSAVTDRSLLARLDQALVEKLEAHDFAKLWLAIPQVIEWGDIGGFRYSPSQRRPLHEDLHAQAFLDSLRGGTPISPRLLRSHSVYAFDTADEHVVEQWTVYRCVYCEVELDGLVYVLSDGKWYRIEASYRDDLEAKFRGIERAQPPLPVYNDASEGAYNERIARDVDGIVLMDQRFVHMGRNPIEFCDLYTADRRMIHVKRYGAARVLSHLFAQGMTSAILFHGDPEFRTKLNDVLPQNHRLADPNAMPQTSDYDVVYAIVSNAPGDIELPLFSKLNLVNSVKRLRGLGYRAHVMKIDVEEQENNGE